MINKKIALTSVVLGVVGISGFYVFSSHDKANDVKAQVTAQAVPETKVKKQNLALETALNDFKSLDEFNTKFFDTSDEAWMIPDVSAEGSNDGGNSHGWTTFPTKQRAHDKDIIDNNTGKSVYTIKSSDGAIVGDIRKALAERDAKENPAIILSRTKLQLLIKRTKVGQFCLQLNSQLKLKLKLLEHHLKIGISR